MIEEEDDDYTSSQKTKTDYGDNKLVLSKDNPYTIFHALGKFLYNKSESLILQYYSIGINPKTGKIEQLPYDMMKRDRKPELYFRHKDILNQIQLDKPSFSLYLHENMLDFFTDIGEIADCLDVYSHTDACESRVQYSYDVRVSLLSKPTNLSSNNNTSASFRTRTPSSIQWLSLSATCMLALPLVVPCTEWPSPSSTTSFERAKRGVSR